MIATSAIEAVDVFITSHGTVVTLWPRTQEARNWIDENVQSEGWQWHGGQLVVDRRLAARLIEGLRDAGFEVR